MEKIILNNGVRVLYRKVDGEMTSFCIGFEAGANSEEGFNKGVAHALEHMVFKGTKTRSEKEINAELDEVFAFNNAMTNYPYVIYYGTCSSYDFVKGFRLFSDIINNPSFSEVGFSEEISVILQEANEWKEDFSQYCEDELFTNSYKERRINETIIGNEKSIKSISIKELKDFYNTHYVAENCVITIVSSLEKHEILEELKNFNINEKRYNRVKIPTEKNRIGRYEKEVSGFSGAKIQYIFDIEELNELETEALRLYSMLLGEGVSSLLFEEIRNAKGYAYDISTEFKNEKGIRLLAINTSTSKEKISNTIESIDFILKESIEKVGNLTNEELDVLIKRLVLKRDFWLERGVELAKYVTTNEIMYNKGIECLNYKDILNSIDVQLIYQTAKKVISEPSIQILK
ncbi:pitrilysin family protein [Clostridium sp. YIM B02551]|uniref:M16 family metallopeptidase n=1 Tax=Clostridium sp. YIM B02551 TaxID=2910679 RepID=UPI001EEBF7D2|nr:pitrilysin family protein [Clostridium sp. YIM B02551]